MEEEGEEGEGGREDVESLAVYEQVRELQEGQGVEVEGGSSPEEFHLSDGGAASSEAEKPAAPEAEKSR